MADTTLSMSIDAKGVKTGSDTAVRSLDDIRKKSREATTSVDSTEKSIGVLGNTANRVSGALKGLAAAYGIREIIQAADSYNLLNARIKLVTESQSQATQVYNKLLKSANDNLTSVEASVGLYTRLAAATKQYGASQQEVINITDAVSKTFRISGSSAAEAAAGALQFGQALGSGKLAGDEFKSISENNIRLLQALADGFGVTTGELKKMAADGLLTTEEILKRLPQAFDKINKEAASLPVTVGGAFQVLKNNIIDAIGEFDNATDSSSSFAKSILFIANNLYIVKDRLIDAASAVSALVNAYYIAQDLIARTSIELQKPLLSNEVYTESIKLLDERLDEHLINFSNINKEISKTTTENDKLNESTKKSIKNTDELTKEQLNLLNAQKKLIESRKDLFISTQLEADQALRLNVANQISEEQYKKVSNAIEIENKLREVGLKITDKEGKKIAEQITMRQKNEEGIKEQNTAREEAIKLQEEELRKQEELNEKRAQPFIEASKNIQSGVANSLESAINEGLDNGFNGGTAKNILKSFGDLLKKTLVSSIANSLAASFTSSIVNPVLASVAGSSLGGGNYGGVASALGIAGGLGGLSSSINNFGAGLGFANVGKDFVGPLMPGQTAGTTLSGFLGGGAAGLGIGSLNLFGGKSTGSTIGGTLGGLGGSFFGVPGIIAGSLIGSGLGGLFGAGAKVSAAEFAGNIGANDNLSGLSYGAKNGEISQARGLSYAIGQQLAGLVANGIDIANTNIRGAINSKSGNRFEALGQTFAFDPQDTESVNLAIAKLSVELIKAGDNSGSLAIAMKNIQTEGRKAEDILSDINFAANFDKLGDAPKKLTDVEQAVENLKKQFDDAKETTIRLGLSEEKLAEYRKKQFDLLATEFNKDISAQILAITDPVSASINELNESFDTIRKNAIATGGDMVLVDQLYNLKLSKIQEESYKVQEETAKNYLNSQIENQNELVKSLQSTQSRFDGFAKSLSSFRLGLSLGNLSPLSNEERFREAQRQFTDVSTLAQLGNEDAIGKLQDVSTAYLTAAKDYYGTTAPVFDAVQSALENTESLAARQANIAGQQLTAAQQQVTILTSIRDNLSNAPKGAVNNPAKYGTDPTISLINYLLDEATNFKFNQTFGEGRFNAFAASNAITEAEREAARNVHRAFGYIPAYADGGDFGGGVRLVGERGAELEATGKSRIVSHENLMKALSGGNNAEVVAAINKSNQSNTEEIRLLRRQLAESDRKNREMMLELSAKQEKTNSQLISIMNKPITRAV